MPYQRFRLPKPAKRGGGAGSAKRDYTPLSWTEFYDRQVTVSNDDNTATFNVYIKGKPVNSDIVLFLLHGGGYSGLTWACFAEEISRVIDCTIVAPDLRGHGLSSSDDEYILSTEQQISDIAAIWKGIKPELNDKPVFLMGHSMGGALSVHVASVFEASLCALCVIDVVEGSALDALRGMQTFLRARPTHFNTIQQAIEWCVRTGTVRNHRSARISMPAQIVAVDAQQSTTAVADTNTEHKTSTNQVLEEVEEEGASSSGNVENAIAESGTDPVQPRQSTRYTWRIDLTKTEPHWRGWFEGLSSKYLSVPVPKLLLLAGVDRLDKDLTVGQMQGKFQMIVLPKVGHAVHEDSPGRVADAIATFCVRNKFCKAKAEFSPVFPGC